MADDPSTPPPGAPPSLTDRIGPWTGFDDTHGLSESVDGLSVWTNEPASALPDPSIELRPSEDRYERLQPIGSGAMGRVLRVRDRDFDRVVALKEMLPQRLENAWLRTLFLKEARLAGRLQHPNIVPVYEMGRTPTGEPFFTMRMVEGDSLEQVLRGLAAADPVLVGRWSLRRLLSAMVQVCLAVAYAHDQGVVHRDLKPSNVMLGSYGEVQLLDWGVAEWIEEDSLQRQPPSAGVPGTPGFVAPERLVVGRFDPVKADVWALGAILYRVLSLRGAHDASAPADVLESTRTQDPVAPSMLAPERAVPPELDDICLTALQRDPAWRTPTARALATELEAFLDRDADRERRQAEVAELLEQGRKSVAWWTRGGEEILRAEAEVAELRRSTSAWAPLDSRRQLWRAEDRVSALIKAREVFFAEANRALQTALQKMPGHRATRRELADLWARRHEDELARGDRVAARWSRNQAEAYGDRERPLLRGGWLSVTTTPAGVPVRLRPVAEADRQRRPGQAQDLGITPLVGLDVAAGSHVLEIADVLVPVVVEQAGNHQVEVDLPADLPEGFVFVVGGDLKPAPTEPDGAAGELVAVRSFAVSELPTTFAQYLDFLASMPPEEAQEHVPRALGHGPLAHWQDGWRLDVSALFADEAPACSECLSVVGIGWDDAVAYCDWRSAVLGRVARLPREHEWERAALAGDGRRFPWGDSFEPGFANWRGAQPGPPRLQPVGSFPTDRSLFGVRDMAGGAAEWCLDLWQGHRDLRVVRGAHWATQPRVVAADRAGRHRDERSGAVGFRVVLELS